MAGSSRGNGSATSRWTVESTEEFDADQEKLEAIYPRVGRAFAAVKRQFEILPFLNARRLVEDGEVWLYKTRDAFGSPDLFIYYEIREAERTVCLLAADRAYGYDL